MDLFFQISANIFKTNATDTYRQAYVLARFLRQRACGGFVRQRVDFVFDILRMSSGSIADFCTCVHGQKILNLFIRK